MSKMSTLKQKVKPVSIGLLASLGMALSVANAADEPSSNSEENNVTEEAPESAPEAEKFISGGKHAIIACDKTGKTQLRIDVDLAFSITDLREKFTTADEIKNFGKHSIKPIMGAITQLWGENTASINANELTKDERIEFVKKGNEETLDILEKFEEHTGITVKARGLPVASRNVEDCTKPPELPSKPKAPEIRA
jgi:hypothetical protein